MFLFHLPYITRQHHTSTAIAQHCKSARLTLVKHGLALIRAAHFHVSYMDLNRAIPCWNFEHVSFTLACASPEIGLLNLCGMLQNAAGSGEVVEHGGKNIPSAAGAGAASAATAVAASCVTASARTCNERTASLSRIPIEDIVFQRGHRHCGPETNMQCRIT